MSVQPGWYLDPADPDTRRYWDGEGWLGAPIPADATPPEGPPPPEPVAAPAPASGPATGGHPGPGAGPGLGAPVPGHRPGPDTGAGPVTHPGQPGPAAHPGQPYPGQPYPGRPYPGQPYPAPPNGVPGPGPGAGPPPGWSYPPNWPGRPPLPRPHGLPLASYGARLVARLIDFGAVFLLNVVVNGWFVWRYVEEVSPYLRESFRRALEGNSSTEGLPQPGEQAGGLQIAILLIATALWFAYEVPSMAARGQTFGKRLLGIRALPVEADQPLGFGRATRRWSTLGLPTLLWYCCGLGLLLQLVDAVSPLFDQPLRQALHDKRAQTVVVQLPRARPEPRDTPHDRADPPGDTP